MRVASPTVQESPAAGAPTEWPVPFSLVVLAAVAAGSTGSPSGNRPRCSGRSATKSRLGSSATAKQVTPKKIQAVLSPNPSIITAADMVNTTPPMAPNRYVAPMARPRIRTNQRETTVLAPMGAAVWNTTRALA